MNHFMQWMTESFAPRMNKIAKNPWIASIQDLPHGCKSFV